MKKGMRNLTAILLAALTVALCIPFAATAVEYTHVTLVLSGGHGTAVTDGLGDYTTSTGIVWNEKVAGTDYIGTDTLVLESSAPYGAPIAGSKAGYIITAEKGYYFYAAFPNVAMQGEHLYRFNSSALTVLESDAKGRPTKVQMVWYADPDAEAVIVFASQEKIWDGTAADFFAYGDGTKNTPYLIETAEQFAYFANAVNNGNSFAGKYIALLNDVYLNDTANLANWGKTVSVGVGQDGQDIDASLLLGLTPSPTTGGDGKTIAPENTWTPIGGGSSVFSGTFAGNGHTVHGIYVNDNDSNAGLFGNLSSASITELGVEDSFICGSKAGGIAGYVNGGNIEKCYTRGTTVLGDIAAGGIAGEINTVYAADLYNAATVTGATLAGGLFGRVEGSELRQSYNVGAVSVVGTNQGRRANALVGSVIDYGDSYEDTALIGCFYLDTSASYAFYDAAAGKDAVSINNKFTPLASEDMKSKDTFGIGTNWVFGTNEAYAYPEQKVFRSYQIRFEGRGESLPHSVSKLRGTDYTIPTDIPTYHPDMFEFVGWTTVENGDTAEYAPGSTFTVNADTVFYSVWKPIIAYTVTYCDQLGNAVSGLTPTNIKAGDEFTVTENSPYTREGFTFVGWSRIPNSIIPFYTLDDITAGEAKFVVNENTKLYAAWTKNAATNIIVPADGSFVTPVINDDGCCSKGFAVGTSVSDAIAEFAASPLTYRIIDKNGNIITSGNITTGCRIQLIDFDGNIEDESILIVKGDTNCDGKMNAADASQILRKIAGWNVETFEASLDIDGNGRYGNANDAATILRKLANWPVEIH